jgi:hypothetical protein
VGQVRLPHSCAWLTVASGAEEEVDPGGNALEKRRGSGAWAGSSMVNDDLLVHERLSAPPLLFVPLVEDQLPPKLIAIEHNVQMLGDDLRQAEKLLALRLWPDAIRKRRLSGRQLFLETPQPSAMMDCPDIAILKEYIRGIDQ